MLKGQTAVAERLVRAVGLIEDYDATGHLPDLITGIAELRDIRATLKPAASDLYDLCVGNLATALVRLGEQTSDVALLREAKTLLAELTHGSPFDEVGPDDFKWANAMAIADLRIGTMTGDRELVLRVCKGLALYINAHSNDAALTNLTAKNLAVALLANARQHRSQKVYRGLIDRIAPACRAGSASDRRFYLHCLATALLELGALTGERRHIDEALVSLETALDLCEDSPGLRQSALHSMAKAHFCAAKLSSGSAAIEDARAAVDYCSRSIELLADEERSSDGRMTRLIADRGAYRHIYGMLTTQEAELLAARDDFRTARDRLEPEAAPFLLCQILSGLFLLEYQMEAFADALATFDALRRTWSISLVDPALSVAVLEQQSIEMIGHFSRAAYCRLKTGDPAGAVTTVEAGRSSQLKLAYKAGMSAGRPPSANQREAQDPALRRWESARREGDQHERRLAWQELLQARRRDGLAIVTDDPSEADIRRATPKGGAAAIVFWADDWIRAILVLREPHRFIEIPLPATASTRLRRLVRGDMDRQGWLASYDKFVASETSVSIDEREAARTWNTSIAFAQDVIGVELSDHIDRALHDEKLVPGAEIVVAPPGELAALPLATATLADRTPFQERWPVSILPGLFLRNTQPVESRAIVASPLIVSTASAVSGSMRLPFVEREIARLKLILSANHPRFLTGSDAGVAHVIDGLEKADLIHIASHGRFDPDRPDQSCLFLANGQLSLDRLKTVLPGRMRLVFLSCCESGVTGRSSVPDEFIGFLPSFLQCGADAAIGTLWPVFDDAAMLFAVRFYEELLDSDGRFRISASRALSRAQAWLRTVTIGELVSDGYLSEREAEEIALTHRRAVGMRVRGAPKRMRGAAQADRVATFDPRSRPFGDPIDWAAFVVVGR